jgi:hypothetical protein
LWYGRSGLAVASSKSSSTVATMPVVEAPGVARRSSQPTVEEDSRGQHWRPSTMATPPEVGAQGAAYCRGRPWMRVSGVIHDVHAARGRRARGGTKVGPACYGERP